MGTSFYRNGPRGRYASRQPERNELDNSRNAPENGVENKCICPEDLADEGGDLSKDLENVEIYVLAPCTFITDASRKSGCDQGAYGQL